jgi:hypothetical protein
MIIIVKIIKVAVENKGKYRQAKVSYEETATGKVTSKTLLSFVHEDVFNLVTAAQMDDVFTVELTKEAGKDGKEYWQWVSATKGESAPASATASSKTGTTAVSAPRNTYETPEERAQKQVYIVRQSSITAALTLLLNTGEAKKPAQTTVQNVIDVAKQFEKYVFGQDAMTAIMNMANDLPEEPEVD